MNFVPYCVTRKASSMQQPLALNADQGPEAGDTPREASALGSSYDRADVLVSAERLFSHPGAGGERIRIPAAVRSSMMLRPLHCLSAPWRESARPSP